MINSTTQNILCPHCGAVKQVETGLCLKCHKFPPTVNDLYPDNEAGAFDHLDNNVVEDKEVDLLEGEAMKYIKKIDQEIGTMWTEDDKDIAKHFTIFSQQQNKRLREANTILLEALEKIACMDGEYRDADERMGIAQAAIRTSKQSPNQ